MNQRNPKNPKLNLVIVGIGGQGLITLARVIAEAGFVAGLEVKTSELHGLSQREGSVKVDVRVGRGIFSPLVGQGQADIVLALEIQEALNGLFYAHPGTVFLINRKRTPVFGSSLSEEQILYRIRKVTSRIKLVDASSQARQQFQREILAGMLLLREALKMGLMPFDRNHLKTAIKRLFKGPKRDINLQIIRQ